MKKKQKYLAENKNLKVCIYGQELLRNPLLNKGTAFTKEERRMFHLEGVLPPRITVLNEQLERIEQSYIKKPDDIEKYIYLRSLQDRNETLFYALLKRNLPQLLPIIYTPTVGEAVQKYGQIFRTTRGLFFTPDNIDRFDEIARNILSDDIKMIVATDNQGILGIGDQGVGGMAISIGKLSIYTVAACISPSATLPITLDVGTNNEKLLNDPFYLGIRQKRIKGKEYDLFIEKFVAGVKKNFPGAILQWEDFSKQNAFTNMDRYANELPSFNDDIQGTAAVVLGGINCAMKIKREKLTDQNFLIYGAGAAGIGIARQIKDALISAGLDPEQAAKHLYIVDSNGLLISDRENLDEYKKPFAHERNITSGWKISNPAHISLNETIQNARITVLMGVSAQPNSFSEDIISSMMKNTDEPVIFPLSNPTSLSEADPGEILKLTDGKAIVAAGSPFGNVEVNGKTFEIGQGNNAFIFPGVGLGAIASNARRIPPSFFTAAAEALAETVSEERLRTRCVYPPITGICDVTFRVALAVYKNSIETGAGTDTGKDPADVIRSIMWEPEYYNYIPDF